VRALVLCLALAGCTTGERSHEAVRADGPRLSFKPAPPDSGRPPPSCPEVVGGAWGRAAPGLGGLARREGTVLRQRLADGRDRRLAFAGTHAFDLLDKLEHEGASEAERRGITCAFLADAAGRGAPVVRIWGSLKQTGSPAELERAAELLALVLDENARRSHPLRVVVTLLNHQPGYGAPEPSRGLDDQAPASGWQADEVYLRGGWAARGRGQLAERIARYAALTEAASPYVLGWELVNELDTFRGPGAGRFDGEAGAALRDRFAVPALEALGRAFPQLVLLGDVRGERASYAAWAPSLIEALPPWLRERLVWTSHVYAPLGEPPEAHLHKLALDLELARSHGLAFVIGELGQHVPGAEAGLCSGSARHDLGPLLGAVRAHGVDALLVWGEGRCDLDAGGKRMILGAGADSAEIAADDEVTLELLARARTMLVPTE
jgi:hypothetical protein